MRTMRLTLFMVVLVLAAATGQVGAEDGRSERVRFAKGASSAVIKGQVRAYHYVDYLVHAGAGQTLSVAMTTGNGANYFNVLAPGAGDAAMFNGSMSGERYAGIVPADGDYRIRVYLMRNAARRNEVARYTLSIEVSGQALGATPAAQDALIRGTPFHAAAQVACTVPFEPRVTACDAFVIRRGFDGTATVEVRWGQGMKRRILFVKGLPVSSDSVDPLSHVRQGDTTLVRVGDREIFEVPDALISGG